MLCKSDSVHHVLHLTFWMWRLTGPDTFHDLFQLYWRTLSSNTARETGSLSGISAQSCMPLFAASFQTCSCIASAKLFTRGVEIWLYFVSQAGLEQNKGESFVCCGTVGWLFVLHSYNHYSHCRMLWVLDCMQILVPLVD